MTQRDIDGHLTILTDKIIEAFRKANESPEAHIAHASSTSAAERRKADQENAEIMISCATSLLGGALTDLNRIANALEVIAQNQRSP